VTELYAPPATGPRLATIEVRDGFWATASTQVALP
jgi:hypothetical protein